MSASVMPCDQHVSQEFMSTVVMASLLMMEMTVLSALTTLVYLRWKNIALTLTAKLLLFFQIPGNIKDTELTKQV